MKLLNIIKHLLIGFAQGLKTAVWVEVTTDTPLCVYYFGPFDTFNDAQVACPGYIEDLKSEGADGIKFLIKHCRPAVLTISHE